MSIAYRVSAYNRVRKWHLFNTEMKPTESTRMLDVGFSEEEHCGTDNFLEKNYPYKRMLTALGVDVPNKFKERYPEVNAVQYLGASFPFADQSFDVCWSNAVIEHVGPREKQILFLKEIKRVSKRAYVTTPNRFFPIEVHTRTPLLHYLPKSIFDHYLVAVGKEWAAGEYMYLLSISELRGVVEDAGITDYKIIRNRLAGMTLDFVLVL